ncbi:hypothetical protein FOPE_01459 [Fonsecaea pedrosoi]|nr:hypothetical protein FOPE_01459 [Fonsecaea pedrosoi]
MAKYRRWKKISAWQATPSFMSSHLGRTDQKHTVSLLVAILDGMYGDGLLEFNAEQFVVLETRASDLRSNLYQAIPRWNGSSSGYLFSPDTVPTHVMAFRRSANLRQWSEQEGRILGHPKFLLLASVPGVYIPKILETA